jgi:galactokinase
MDAAHIAETFRTRFGAQPVISSAPGRVNLIGEHTDYNDGFVLPCAIGFTTRAAISSRPDQKLVFESSEFDRPFEFDLRDLPSKALGTWSDYVLGVAISLRDAGYSVGGANLLVHGEVPMGAGLSSSAAIEVASALAFLSLTDTPPDLPRIAKLCQRAENEFVGARVGIMDQFVSCLGKRGHALLLDCRSLDFQFVPIADKVKLVISNTMVKHEHSGGEYNQRRLECEEGVRILAQSLPGIKALRDVTPDQLVSFSGSMPLVIYKRCLHVVEENRRVLRSVDCLRANDFEGMGRLMRESHVSLRDLYQVSCRELDLMVESATGLPGYYGGRMTGGGFGGSTVNLVSSAEAEAFREEIAKRYRDETGIWPEVYICSPADGARLELKATAV